MAEVEFLTPLDLREKQVAVEHVSGRQGRRVSVDARVGRLRYEGALTPFAPLLTLGAILNAGKGRSMGFGGIRWRWVEV